MSVANARTNIREFPAPYDSGIPAPAGSGHMTVISDEARIKARSLGMVALGLYCELEGRCNREGRCWPLVDTLASDFGCTTRHVQDTLRKLKAAGLVEVLPRFGPTGMQLGNEFVLPFHQVKNASNSRGEPTPPEIPQFPSDLRGELGGELGGEPSRAHVMEVSNREVVGSKDPPSSPQVPSQRELSESFDRFWEAYPKRKAKQDAAKAWFKRKPDPELVETILAAIAVQRQSHDWRKDDGQFIPFPATWLNRAGWSDEVNVDIEPMTRARNGHVSKEDRRQAALEIVMRRARGEA